MTKTVNLRGVSAAPRIEARADRTARGALGAGSALRYDQGVRSANGEVWMLFDVVIIGGGPAGLSAALTLGRACRRVLLCDAGPRRNAPAAHVHNFVTRDGATPDAFRGAAREQLGAYPNVTVREDRVVGVTGVRGAFAVAVGADTVEARRVLLCTGMIDEMLPIEGFDALWGRSVVQCPYCHGWESRGRPWGFLARPEHTSHLQMFALQLRAWTPEVCVFTNGAFDLPSPVRDTLVAGGLRVEAAPIRRLIGHDGDLAAIELSDGARVPCGLLFAHPPQRQVELVRALSVGLDADGFVVVDPMTRQTTVPGVYAAGDLTTRMQAAVAAAASGMQTGAMINFELAMELASNASSE
jgi:thioredoxin reductase